MIAVPIMQALFFLAALVLMQNFRSARGRITVFGLYLFALACLVFGQRWL